MKLIALSDTHLKTDSLSVPEGDVLVHAGDALSSGSQQEFLKFLNWFGGLPHKHKIYVPGNHDWFVHDNTNLANMMLKEKNITLLVDEELTIDGVRFYGTPWTPEFCGWAYMKDDLELYDIFERIPEGTDVLISHGPPKGYLDRVRSKEVGSTPLKFAIDRVRPKLVLCGHIHCGQTQGDGQGHDFIYHNDGKITHICNVSVLNEAYEISNSARLFNL